MSRKYNIRNLDDLHAEVSRLKAEYRFKEEVLIDDSKKYVRQFTPGNLIKRFATPSAFLKADDKYNISSTVLSWALPIFMNRTLFKGSGILTKTLVGLASGKVGKSLDAEHISGIFNAVKSIFTGSGRKKTVGAKDIDYGIPPDSETY